MVFLSRFSEIDFIDVLDIYNWQLNLTFHSNSVVFDHLRKTSPTQRTGSRFSSKSFSELIRSDLKKVYECKIFKFMILGVISLP